MTTEEFAQHVDELWRRTKNGELRDRQARFAEIERVIDEYIAKYGQRPNRHLLDRLATLCLYEEVTDKDRMKMRKNEYPIMSDEQLARRKEGKHKRDEDGIYVEVPFSVANNIGIDRRDYGLPRRRKRSAREIEKIERNLL